MKSVLIALGIFALLYFAVRILLVCIIVYADSLKRKGLKK